MRGEREESIELDLVTGYGDSYAAAIAHFASALISGEAFETDVHENLHTLALVEDAYSKARPIASEPMSASVDIDPLERAVAALQEDIVLGRLAPGARLIEEDLADRLHTKRHVLRQAFVELERFGLIERKRNHGASVRQLTLEDVSQIYAVAADPGARSR